MHTIKVIYTGGTIGMVPGEHGLEAAPGFEARLLQAAPEFSNNAELSLAFLEYEQPIDSALAGLDLAVRIARDILAAKSQCDRFLVLMGSDTLSYIAPALAYLLHDQSVRVAVCGSMRPMGVPGSDALANIRLAIEHLQAGTFSGVQVAFGKELIPAVRCTKLYTHVVEAMVNTQSPQLQPRACATLNTPTEIDPSLFRGFDIRTVRVMPSLHKNAVPSLLSGNPDAIIIQCYGSGTVPGASSDFARALIAADAAAVPLVSISQALYSYVDFTAYASSRWLLDLGVVSCGDMNLEATYTKLWYLLNLGFRGPKLKQHMLANLCGELCAAP